MKIVFVCGSLEPGYDGVGDYVRRLACDLSTRAENKVCLISINERRLIKPFSDENFEFEGVVIPVLRLSNKVSYQKRFSVLEKWIVQFEPEWLSLQYVPFSFNSKGIYFGLHKLFAKIGQGKKWHIMFHELWVGMDQEATKKHLVLGKIQQVVIGSLIKTLNPLVIHTQTHLYREKLRQLGYKSSFLPLFSNIPLNERNKINTTSPYADDGNVHNLVFVLFGNIHHGAPVFQLTNELRNYQEKQRVGISLIIIGRGGTEEEYWSSEWRSKGFFVESMGMQSPEIVSKVFLNANIGVSTTPIVLAEKSGSVAAMREHNLPILCVARPWNVRGLADLHYPSDIIEYKVGKLTECLTVAFNSTPENNKVSDVSQTLISALNYR